MEEELLNLENRKRIYNLILLNPGLHLREIQRHLDMPIGLLDYHLKYMEKHGLLISKSDGGYLRYYATNKVPDRLKEVFSFLRHEIGRTIIIYLLLNPGATHGQILDNLSVSGATLSYHLRKMVGAGILIREKDGRESRYRVREQDMVADAIITYKRSFVDKLVDAFVRSWTESNSGRS